MYDDDAAQRVIETLDAEYKRNIPDEMRRVLRVDAFTSDHNHPYSKFTTGITPLSTVQFVDQADPAGEVLRNMLFKLTNIVLNIRHLIISGNKDILWYRPIKNFINVGSMLKTYHDDNYTSNLMSLAVIGNQSLDELQSWIEPMFSAIPNLNVKMPMWYRTPFKEKELLTQLDIVPLQNIKQLFIKFYVPDPSPFYRNGVSQFNIICNAAIFAIAYSYMYLIL